MTVGDGPPTPGPKIQSVGRLLKVDAAMAETARAFREADIPSILLKGASFARWLYEEKTERLYTDSDLLVRVEDFQRAEGLLESLGFKRYAEETPFDRPASASTWFREDGAVVDLHRTITGTGVPAERVWEVLSANREQMVVLNESVTTLNTVGRALHVALHAAVHGGQGQWGKDLERALSIEDLDVWKKAASLAEELGAEAAFAAGLRVVPEGEAVARRLELSPVRPAEITLRLERAPHLSGGLQWFLSMPGGLLARTVWLWHKVVPTPTTMRRLYPRTNASTGQLVLAYLRRPFWILQRLPAAIGAVRAARRAERETRLDND
jgi:hypothetical protein